MRSEYDRLIDEYISGTMSPAARREFDSMVATDPSLRRLLDAELEITRSVRRNIGSIPKPEPAMSASLMARIAETAPAGSHASSGHGAAASGAGSSAWSWVITAVVLCGVGAGLLLSPRREPAHQAEVAVGSSVRMADSTSAPSMLPSPQPGASLERTAGAQSPDTSAPIRDNNVAVSRSMSAATPARTPKPSRPASDQPKPHRQDDERAIREYMEQNEKRAPAPVEVNDKIHTTVQMDP